jgi:hypothetical protein
VDLRVRVCCEKSWLRNIVQLTTWRVPGNLNEAGWIACVPLYWQLPIMCWWVWFSDSEPWQCLELDKLTYHFAFKDHPLHSCLSIQTTKEWGMGGKYKQKALSKRGCFVPAFTTWCCDFATLPLDSMGGQ